jgi:hypothetical protein
LWTKFQVIQQIMVKPYESWLLQTICSRGCKGIKRL